MAIIDDIKQIAESIISTIKGIDNGITLLTNQLNTIAKMALVLEITIVVIFIVYFIVSMFWIRYTIKKEKRKIESSSPHLRRQSLPPVITISVPAKAASNPRA